MIIHIIGTSGSGKSTVARDLLAQSEQNHPVHEANTTRKHPIGHELLLPGVGRGVYLVGAYPPGLGTVGCDTIKDVNVIFDIALARHRAGWHVIYEGLFTMNHTRGPELARAVGPGQLSIIRLDTPEEECFRRINTRRAEVGKGPLPPERKHNTAGTFIRARNYASKMSDSALENPVPVYKVATEDGAAKIMELLRDH